MIGVRVYNWPMPRSSRDFLALARKGAEHRLAELHTEIASLIKSFPHLRSTAVIGRTPRKRNRRTMSAAARKAVSARMKKYWAARRKTKKA